MNPRSRKTKKRGHIKYILLISVFLLFIFSQYNLATWQKCLVEQHPQPVFLNGSQGGYYPSVIFDPDSFGENIGSLIGSGPGTYAVRPYYKMWFTDGTVGSQIGFAYSGDGINWLTCPGCFCSGLTNPHHVAVVYTGSTYMMWYWDTSLLYTQAAIRAAESVDGLSWINDQTTTGNLITGLNPDWNRGSYGPCQVFYNAGAPNTGTDPFQYRFIMYFDGTTGAFEETGLGYSTDGSDWQLVGRVLARGNGGPWGNTDDWDSSYASRCTVVKVSINEWHMWYSGGQTSMNEGIGHAISGDGINWTRDPGNPLLHISDGLSYRNNRTYTPWVLFREDRFGGHGDSIKFKGWFSARGDSGLKTVCHLGTDQLADLSLSKTADNTNPPVGSDILFTITAANNGIVDASGVIVTDLLPPGLTFLSSFSSVGSYDHLTGVWQIGPIAVNDSASLQITAGVEQPGAITNTSEITASDQLDPDSDPGDNAPGEDDRDSVEINADTPPTADAGKDQTVCTGTEVVLDGTGSVDPDGESLRYNWRFVSLPPGSAAVLLSANSTSPFFTPDLPGEYLIRLSVTDPQPVPLSDNDDVRVTAEVCNQPPVAVISGDSSVCSLPKTVTISGEDSFDPDGKITAFKWEMLKKPRTSTAFLASSNAGKTSFEADLPGVYSIALQVKDDREQWSALTVKPVTANTGAAPVIAVKGTRNSESAWIIRRDYFDIIIEVRTALSCPMQIEKFLVYRKAEGEGYLLLRELALTGFSQDGQVFTYAFRDRFFNSRTIYTYRVAAVDLNGNVVSSAEKTL